MVKRALLIFVTLAALSIWPVAAQGLTTSAVDFVPADFAAFVQVRMDAPDLILQDLNIVAFVASRLEPLRISLGSDRLGFDDFIPITTTFDVDGVSFNDNILPWLGDDMVIAYRDFDSQLSADAGDALLIFSTGDVLESANSLSPVLEGQDLLKQEVYRGITIYIGDKTSIALTAPAVFVGPTDLIHDALDVQAGVRESMTRLPVQVVLHDTVGENPAVYAFVKADYVLPAVSGLLGGQPSTEALLAAFGGALSQIRGDGSFETLLLDHGFDGVAAGLNVVIEADEITVSAQAVFHAQSAPAPIPASSSENSLIDMIPQTALLVGNGTDAEGMVYNVITALPMSNFAREIIGGLPIQTIGTDSQQITVPDAGQVERAVNGYLNLMTQFQNFDLKTDLLDYLSGDYAVALLPRPNDPVPVLNTPFDFLIVARVSDESAALAGATTLLSSMLHLDSLDGNTIEGWDFNRLGVGGQEVISLGAQDGVLVIGTGDAVQKALDARRGDNRISKQQPWQVLSATETPGLYLDSFVFLNTFFPSPGGTVASANNRAHFAFNGHYLGSGLFELTLTAVVPNG